MGERHVRIEISDSVLRTFVFHEPTRRGRDFFAHSASKKRRDVRDRRVRARVACLPNHAAYADIFLWSPYRRADAVRPCYSPGRS